MLDHDRMIMSGMLGHQIGPKVKGGCPLDPRTIYVWTFNVNAPPYVHLPWVGFAKSFAGHFWSSRDMAWKSGSVIGADGLLFPGIGIPGV
jgi:hypothetical protein